MYIQIVSYIIYSMSCLVVLSIHTYIYILNRLNISSKSVTISKIFAFVSFCPENHWRALWHATSYCIVVVLVYLVYIYIYLDAKCRTINHFVSKYIHIYRQANGIYMYIVYISQKVAICTWNLLFNTIEFIVFT